MKTKIAIFTKAEYSKEMNDIVASLKADERFDVFEIEDGKNIPSDCKNLIVFGGDGTVLEAVKNIREDVVVTGVNTGNLGFLTQFEKNSSASEIANGILEGKIEQRAIVDVRFDDFCNIALNEIVLSARFTSAFTLTESLLIHITATAQSYLRRRGLRRIRFRQAVRCLRPTWTHL